MSAFGRSLTQVSRFCGNGRNKLELWSRPSQLFNSKGGLFGTSVTYRCLSESPNSASHNHKAPESAFHDHKAPESASHNHKAPDCATQNLKLRTMNSVCIQNGDQDTAKKASLVIFDKDGTLICFQSMWSPWAKKIASNLENATGLNLKEKVFDTLGVCNESARVLPGVLAEGTNDMVRKDLLVMLQKEGIDEASARKIVQNLYEDCLKYEDLPVKSLTDLRILFKILQNCGVKVAVCTADSRKGTEKTLKSLRVMEYVDKLVCGDDANSQPKPAPHNAHLICEQLGVDPAYAVMVGDTKADVGMGRAANLGWNVGVLSGVGQTNDLYPEANHVIENVKDLLPLILPQEQWQECYQYSSEERILVEPPSWENSSEEVSEQKIKADVALVIFDLHGTILCTHSKYAVWLETICNRLEQVTGLQLSDRIYEKLGLCQDSGKLKQGLLNEYGTKMEVKSALAEIIHGEGLPYEESLLAINTIWQECQPILMEQPKALHKDIKDFFKTLKKAGVRIAICTGDMRELALSDLKNLGVLKYVDMMVCGDDPHQLSKTSNSSTQLICDELSVDLAKTVVVGDSAQDFNTSKINKRIGVLTGVGSKADLLKVTDHVVPNVNDVLSHILEDEHVDKTSAQSRAKAFVPPVIPMNKGKIPASGQCVAFSTSSRKFSTTSTAFSGESVSSSDYVIVGAGSAGSVLANRLSASPDNKVVVLEAGPKDYLWNWKIHMPAALMYNLCDDKVNWYYHTEPEKHMNNRVMYWPRGRVWGGSSSLNAMVYIRGNALDYDGWEAAGADGWSYADCLPYFRKSQTHELGADDYRGGDGPLQVSRGKTDHPLHHKFIEAGMQAGLPFTDDMNGYQQEGVGWMDMTISKGQRWSASRGYLRPSEQRPNVNIVSKALTTRVLFEDNRAVGVEYEKDGKIQQVRANKEVILSGGAINSPQLLMLSGIGNADELKKLGIDTVAHLPGVGENLQDHLEVYVQQECTQPITLYTAQWKFPHNMVRIGMQWFLSQTGDGATTHLESGGFVRGDDTAEFPNIQFHFLPSTVNDHGREAGDRHAFQLHAGTLRATSRGFLKLKSNNPKEHPRIVANYLSTEQDIREIRQAVRWSREVFRQKAFDDFRGPELYPGKDVQSDAEIDAFCRARGDSAYHPSCTCKMGSTSDPMTVVDSHARVLGVEGLRVVDASIMPNVVSGNLNGPTIMLAEKTADLILGNKPLAKSNAAVYRHQNKENVKMSATV